MQNKLSFFLLLTIVGVSFNHCTYHNSDDYFKDNPEICYTEDLSFQMNVFPILENNCISCHNTTNLSGGINLSTYGDIRPHAESGLLMGVLLHDEAYTPMPLNASQLSECNLLTIEAWINQGLKDN